MMNVFLRELTLGQRISADIAKWNANQDKEYSNESLIAHIDLMHSLIHKAKEGITSADYTGTGDNFKQAIRALKAITAMQSYIKWDEEPAVKDL